MRSVLIVLGVAMIPSLAAAQAPREEVAYCRQLAHSYEHYIGRSEKSPDHDIRRGTLDAQMAAAQCDSRTADAIRVLEQSLRNGKVALPSGG